MKKIYSIRIEGGPWDGTKVDVPNLPLRFVLSLPTRPDAAASWESNQQVAPANGNCSKYLMTSSRCVEENGGAKVHVKYCFLSFEVPCNRVIAGQEVRRIWRTVVTLFLSDCRQRLAVWMMAPVDYPLDVRRLCPAEGADANCRPQAEAPRTAHEPGSRSARFGRIATKHT
jgi:hypothetical protein